MKFKKIFVDFLFLFVLFGSFGESFCKRKHLLISYRSSNSASLLMDKVHKNKVPSCWFMGWFGPVLRLQFSFLDYCLYRNRTQHHLLTVYDFFCCTKMPSTKRMGIARLRLCLRMNQSFDAVSLAQKSCTKKT